MGESPAVHEELLILVPLYNDWIAFDLLLEHLDAVLAGEGLNAGVLAVDDGSSDPRVRRASSPSFQALRSVDVLPLRRNLGHQRALAVSMAYVEDHGRCEALVVMDGDGEDDPRDVPRLLERCRAEDGRKIVFAERTRRSESWLFRAFYVLYKAAHRVLTGYGVRVGNFSVIPRERLGSLVVVSDLWNHYAAAAMRSRQPFCTIPTRRSKRLHGASKMNFVGLIVHGLSAISVYSDIVGIRMLIVSTFIMAAASCGILAIVAIRVLTDWAIPGWATYSAGILAILIFQSLTFMLIFSMVILGGRNASSFLPRRDYGHFVGDARPLDESE